jgi:hypothetical protein
MSDGKRLSARIWLPEGADQQQPVPAILEYIPYRKRDMTRARDALMHPYFAGYGYASVRVDLRGSGDSEGVLQDEYLQQELDDGVEVLHWLAQQSWCNGRVGMIGISWGGFNGLQIAALQPPELKAIVTVCSTDDRYTDDIHHMGGCLLGDNLSWASTMFAYNSLPPDPQIVGDQWRDLWFQRLEGSGLWLAQWLRHQTRDAYWRHGSVAENYGAITCPVLAVSGWADGYSNAVFRLLEHLQVPCKGLIGPWGHKYPHIGVPGPAIGFLQECLRWWDGWLQGRETGVQDDPALRVWMQASMPPTTRYQERPGRWVAEPTWPSPRIMEKSLILAATYLTEPTANIPSEQVTVRSPLTVGLFAGKWCSYTAAPDLPHDQRQEDGGALTFDSPPLTQDMEILGRPRVELTLSSDQPVAMIAVRLSDVAPDDKATRVTYGLLNLTHRHNSEVPEPLEIHQQYSVCVELNGIAQTFPKGHRLRLSISTSYWPLAWLPPHPTRLSIFTGISRFVLPLRPFSPEEDPMAPFAKPEAAPPLYRQLLEPEHHNWRVIRDLDSDVSELEVINDSGTYYIPEIDLTVQRCALERYISHADDFTSVRGETLWERSLWRQDWSIKTRTRTMLACTPEEFLIQAELDAYENGKRVYSQNWDYTIPRVLV